MLVIFVMMIGVLLGMIFYPIRYKVTINRATFICTLILIFIMGVNLGQRENFLEELATLGIEGLVLSIVPIICSTIVVYFLTQRFFKNEMEGDKK